MTISPKNALRAARMVGLDRSGPIEADVKAAKIAQAGRLARFMDQLDQPIPEDVLAEFQTRTRKIARN